MAWLNSGELGACGVRMICFVTDQGAQSALVGTGGLRLMTLSDPAPHRPARLYVGSPLAVIVSVKQTSEREVHSTAADRGW